MNFKLYLSFVSILFVIACKSEKHEPNIVEQKDFCASIHQDSSQKSSEWITFPDSLTQYKTGVYVLEDGGNAMISRAWLCENAKNSIDIQYFIFSTDNVGLIACDYLIKAADKGIKVRILVDDIMVDADADDVLTLDSHENIEIKIYNPGVNLGKNLFQKLDKFTSDFRSANQRMHNKTFIVDSKVVITGGRNIADEYFDYDHEYNFRDRDVLFFGKTTKVVQSSFEDFWSSKWSFPITKVINNHPINTNPNRFDKLHQYACNPENFWPQIRDKITQMPSTFKNMQESKNFVWVDSVQFVSDIPGKNDGTKGLKGSGATTEALIRLIKQAKKSIIINTPYLITTELSRNLFSQANKKGIKIQILTNSLASTDNLEAFNGYQRDRKKLLETGVEIYEFKPNAMERFNVMTGALQEKMNFTPIFGLHSKSMVIDDSITVIGTFNLDPRSANLNTECITIIHNSQITKGVSDGMKLELLPENAWRTTLQYNPDKEVDLKKRLKTFSKSLIPKDIL
jgi:cardiolipin synthase C